MLVVRGDANPDADTSRQSHREQHVVREALRRMPHIKRDQAVLDCCITGPARILSESGVVYDCMRHDETVFVHSIRYGMYKLASSLACLSEAGCQAPSQVIDIKENAPKRRMYDAQACYSRLHAYIGLISASPAMLGCELACGTMNHTDKV